MVFLRKLDYNNSSAPTFLILFKNYMRDYKGQTIKVIAVLYDRFLLYRTVKS